MTISAWHISDRKLRRQPSEGSDQRTEFQRDRDRLIYSSAFHRLAGVTQIVRAGEAGIFHTRQQHTIKVAQVGRRLAEWLCEEQKDQATFRGLDAEVVEAACIAHDLGHPPFGHIGEETLHKLVIDKDDDGFEGNAQSFRIVCKLSVRFPEFGGMNLTRATLAACLKYPWFRTRSGKHARKWSAYKSEKDDFDFARADHRDTEAKTLEAELMDWADDVAYSVHDIEDFHRCNALPWRQVLNEKGALINHALGEANLGDTLLRDRYDAAYNRLKAFFDGNYSELLSHPYEGTRRQREQLRRMTSNLIGIYIRAVRIADNDSQKAVKFEMDFVDEVQILKQITRDYIIGSPTLAAQQRGQRKIIGELFDALTSEPGSALGYPAFLPIRLRYLRELDDTNPTRFVADCISSLSESEAIALHARLTGTITGSVLDPIVR